MKRHFYIVLCFAVINFSKGSSSTTPSTETPTIPTISSFTESSTSEDKVPSDDDLFLLIQENLKQQQLEDEKTINETLEKYGPLRDFNMLGLPGPEIAVDEDRFNFTNIFEPPKNGTYKIRLRTITDKFSYNSRYEEGTITKEKGIETPVIKGQFGEHFDRKNGYYLRTIGYIMDKNGYRQFLLDLIKAEFLDVYPISGGPGGPEDKDRISSTVLGTLIGGNLG